MAKIFYETGRYLCRLGKHDMIEKASGPQFTLRFEVLARYDNKNELHDVTSYERTFYRVINENTVGFAIADLRSLGFDKPTFGALSPDDPNAFIFEGIEVDMWCGRDTYQGDEREKWSVAKKAGGGGEIEGTRADKKTLRNLDNLFGKELRKQVQPEPAATPRPVAVPPQGVSEDDVPF